MISVSLLSSNDRLKLVKDLNFSNTDLIHIDVMDGRFVKNKEFLKDEMVAIANASLKKLDVHLLSYNPINDIKIFDYYPKLKKKIEYVTIHFEIGNVMDNINEIKRRGYKVGIAISPDVSINDVLPYFKYVDLVLIMSVVPGVGGSEFIEESISRIKEVRKIINNGNYEVVLAVDGGIKDYNACDVYEAGADTLVVGSYVSLAKDVDKSISIIRKCALKKYNIFFPEKNY